MREQKFSNKSFKTRPRPDNNWKVEEVCFKTSLFCTNLIFGISGDTGRKEEEARLDFLGSWIASKAN